MVVVNRLPQERHFLDPGIDQLSHLVNDILRRSVDLGPAGEGDDTVSAVFVAAPRDPDIRLEEVVARGNAAGEVQELKLILSGREGAGTTRRSSHQRNLPPLRAAACP